jgi:hypothetical protein
MTSNTNENHIYALMTPIHEACIDEFAYKLQKYGTTFKYFRQESLTDQILIKAKRLKHIAFRDDYLVQDETFQDTFRAIINYSTMYIIVAENRHYNSIEEIKDDHKVFLYNCLSLAQQKNYDYGDAWRELRLNSIVDLIYVKLKRIVSMESPESPPTEGGYLGTIVDNYKDIINYATYAIILLNEQDKRNKVCTVQAG